ncbi:MAG: CBS domain-containing protein [Planctomycetota bacterium]|jgi:CBS domain-containing protein
MENRQLQLIDVLEQMCFQKNIRLRPMRVARDIMNADVETLTLDHTVRHCLKVMERRRVRHVPVVDLPYAGEEAPYFVGLVSQRDVLRQSTADTEQGGKHKPGQQALRQLLVQIVARKPKSVSPQTPVQDVITTMTCHHIDMVPVLDGADLVGIVTTADLMRVFLKLDGLVRQLYPELETGAPPAGMASESSAKTEMLCSWVFRAVQEVMTKQVICLEPQDNLARAIEVLQAEEFRHVLVMDEHGKVMGLVSDRDILRNLPFAGRRPPSPPKKFREHLFAANTHAKSLQLPLKSIMVREVLHILPSRSATDAANILHKEKIGCLPVVDEHQQLRGIVTVTDLMRALLAAYEPVETVGADQSKSWA